MHLAYILVQICIAPFIGGNTDPGEQANDCSGPLNSHDYNLIQDIKGCTITGITSHNLTEVNPGLSPLQDNGGPTLTHALVADSPAIDASNPAGCIDHQGHTLGFDQRGFFRIVDGDSNGSAICDMGAYEFGSTAPSYFIYLPIIGFISVGRGFTAPAD